MPVTTRKVRQPIKRFGEEPTTTESSLKRKAETPLASSGAAGSAPAKRQKPAPFASRAAASAPGTRSKTRPRAPEVAGSASGKRKRSDPTAAGAAGSAPAKRRRIASRASGAAGSAPGGALSTALPAAAPVIPPAPHAAVDVPRIVLTPDATRPEECFEVRSLQCKQILFNDRAAPWGAFNIGDLVGWHRRAGFRYIVVLGPIWDKEAKSMAYSLERIYPKDDVEPFQTLDVAVQRLLWLVAPASFFGVG